MFFKKWFCFCFTIKNQKLVDRIWIGALFSASSSVTMTVIRLDAYKNTRYKAAKKQFWNKFYALKNNSIPVWEKMHLINDISGFIVLVGENQCTKSRDALCLGSDIDFEKRRAPCYKHTYTQTRLAFQLVYIFSYAIQFNRRRHVNYDEIHHHTSFRFRTIL